MTAAFPARPTVIVVGLGPAGPELTTPAATEALAIAPVAFLRTSRHPAATGLLGLANVVALDDCYDGASSFEEVYRSIVGILLAAAAEHGRVAYAVPGSPAVAERSVELLRAEESIDLEVVPGLSFCELAWTRLGIDPLEAGVRLVDAESFAVQAAGDAGPFLVGQCWSGEVLSSVKLSLDDDPLPAVLLHHLGLADESVVEVPWSEIDKTLQADHLTSLYVPRLEAPVAGELVCFAELVRVLRERCPWDREQTHGSLVRHLLEETYEAIEAIEMLGDDPAGAPPAVAEHVCEELGDLLCQVFFHATLAEEEGLFSLADIARGVHDKLVVRHPHVFGDVTAATPGAVVANWERIKQSEKRRTHLFEGVPAAMPALAGCQDGAQDVERGPGLARDGARGWSPRHVAPSAVATRRAEPRCRRRNGNNRRLGRSCRHGHSRRYGRSGRRTAARHGETRRAPGRGSRGARAPGAGPARGEGSSARVRRRRRRGRPGCAGPHAPPRPLALGGRRILSRAGRAWRRWHGREPSLC